MRLGEQDVRNLVRLVGEVAALPGGHAEKKRFVMEGLSRLIDADAWVWGLSCQREPDKPQMYVSMLKGGLSEERFARLLQAVEDPGMIVHAGPFFAELAERKEHLTRLRDQLTDIETLKASPVGQLWKAADIGPTIFSMRPLDERSSSTIAFYRRHDRHEFTERESRIAHILLTEVPWLHQEGWPEDRGVRVPTLSKQQRLTLNLLISGQSRKEIASNMQISVHTAQGYVKDVYRFFEVGSQAELMNRFFQGNGRDAA